MLQKYLNKEKKWAEKEFDKIMFLNYLYNYFDLDSILNLIENFFNTQ